MQWRTPFIRFYFFGFLTTIFLPMSFTMVILFVVWIPFWFIIVIISSPETSIAMLTRPLTTLLTQIIMRVVFAIPTVLPTSNWHLR